MIKSKSPNKFYIEQFILNDLSTEQDFKNWLTVKYNKLIKDKACIGYLFNTREGTLICEKPKILNLYLIKREYYNGNEVNTNNLINDWDRFNTLLEDQKNPLIFVNPPIEQWLATKDNWCKKLASKLASQFELSFNEALSDVYFTVMKCYRRGTVYMGSLNYIRNSVYNEILMSIRSNKIRVNQDSGLATSIDVSVMCNDDGEELTLLDMLADEHDIASELEQKQLLDNVIAELSKTFSVREIDQVLNTRLSMLPRALYIKLYKWRQKHKLEDFYEQEKC